MATLNEKRIDEAIAEHGEKIHEIWDWLGDHEVWFFDYTIFLW